ncbi:PREDICTED: uncharacterized protein LOC105360745 [Ceratosolen solmsi marchali]|uniref:Uncharacterized protein LOC105360745 n=1 Tax=Ceratosolen solmsi marchali TaxID=326594 RepID=A0AAJ6YDG9_9HYME|nr:PREDICTED: uncharacterized protein LOC105360745 [Ceratosolen solmsi marchali]
MKVQVLMCTYLCFGFVLGLKEVRIQTPIAVKKGESTKLYCWYDIEGDPLYIVKWYKSGHEFYRYAPQEKPATKSFVVGNLHVKESESNATQVTLINVDVDAAGCFSCEVSADAPSFQTAIASGNMNVVELPFQRPIISGLRNKYRINDVLKLSCSSSYSRPAANLTWYINNNQATESFASIKYINNTEQNISMSTLQFQIKSDSFYNGTLKIRCSASIYDIYWQSTEVSAEEDKLKITYIEPISNVIGINYHQPPPNFQLGQTKLDGEIDIKVIGNSAVRIISHIITLKLIGVCRFFIL